MEQTRLKGPSKGYKKGAVFDLANHQVWQQTSDEEESRYSLCPVVLLDVRTAQTGRLMLARMHYSVEVRRLR